VKYPKRHPLSRYKEEEGYKEVALSALVDIQGSKQTDPE
jgi:hypothetical protein